VYITQIAQRLRLASSARHGVAADPVAKASLLACAMGSADLALSACWAAPLDIAPSHAGVVTGFMNTFGNIGGFVCPIVVGWAVGQLHSWTVPFYIAAAVYAVGAMAWLAVDPTRQSRSMTDLPS